jgi:drug/metabolite transporter (DMT)-like permease
MVAYLSLLFVGLIWGSTFAVIKDSLNNLGPFAILLLRFIVASAVLYLVILKNKLNIRDHLKEGIITGGLQFLTYVPQVIGLLFTSPTNSAFITGLYVIFIPSVHLLLNRQKPKVIEIAACFVALAGLWILTGGISGWNIGDMITLGTAIAIAFYITYSSKVMNMGANPIVFTFHQMWVSAVLSGVGLVIFRQNLITDHLSAYLSVIYLGLFASALAYLIQNLMLKKVNLVVASILLSTEPLFALIISWVMGYEPVQMARLIGGIVMFTAIILPDVSQSALFHSLRLAYNQQTPSHK